ncbi:unnamed protein product [Amoebophrya sp. A25]|nr:unnamed protein product [Amoebophrya sp. A25]|eukprot:GSA25T00023657001.1
MTFISIKNRSEMNVNMRSSSTAFLFAFLNGISRSNSIANVRITSSSSKSGHEVHERHLKGHVDRHDIFERGDEGDNENPDSYASEVREVYHDGAPARSELEMLPEGLQGSADKDSDAEAQEAARDAGGDNTEAQGHAADAGGDSKAAEEASATTERSVENQEKRKTDKDENGDGESTKTTEKQGGENAVAVEAPQKKEDARSGETKKEEDAKPKDTSGTTTTHADTEDAADEKTRSTPTDGAQEDESQEQALSGASAAQKSDSGSGRGVAEMAAKTEEAEAQLHLADAVKNYRHMVDSLQDELFSFAADARRDLVREEAKMHRFSDHIAERFANIHRAALFEPSRINYGERHNRGAP